MTRPNSKQNNIPELPLRIAIINGCLEPGRDGVGDYTHALASEAMRCGVRIMEVAIADRYASNDVKHARDGVTVVRYPVTMAMSTRMQLLQTVLADFQPDWLSLQFVPYSFHRRGWLHGLTRQLKPLVTGANCSAVEFQMPSLHLMIHELWLGIYSKTSLKHRIEGIWQRQTVLRFIRAMQPAIVHTTNSTYAQTLHSHGVKAKILPLFGNIPIEASPTEQQEADAWWASEIQAMGVLPDDRQNWWVFGVFGSIHREWWPEDLFNELLTQPSLRGRRLALVTAGRSGVGGAEVIQRLGRKFAGKLCLRELGEQSPTRVASIFRHLDFGIATTPWELIGKSGSTAAMRDHGVPVIVTSVGARESEDSCIRSLGDPQLLRYHDTLPSILNKIHRDAPRDRRSAVCQQWLASLSTSDRSCGRTQNPRVLL